MVQLQEHIGVVAQCTIHVDEEEASHKCDHVHQSKCGHESAQQSDGDLDHLKEMKLTRCFQQKLAYQSAVGAIVHEMELARVVDVEDRTCDGDRQRRIVDREHVVLASQWSRGGH